MHIKRLIFISLIFFLAGKKLEDSFLFFCAVHTFVLALCVTICKLEILSNPKSR
jgi:hypothetical protein